MHIYCLLVLALNNERRVPTDAGSGEQQPSSGDSEATQAFNLHLSHFSQNYFNYF